MSLSKVFDETTIGRNAMKYMLLAYGNEDRFNQMSKDELAEVGEKCGRFDAEMQAAGEVTWAGSLDWSSKSMRLKDGKLTVTDGPFAETKEVVGGVVIIEAPDFDAAVKLASLHPAARMGEELGWGIELRPINCCPAIREPEAARGE
ncbi:YciI family protein [Marinobacter lacisalsi]|uniref:YciI family protein n=1 Tax=Marinobacter lacisalsi TaxID=475979 RepID=A0ABV8QG56_9GAMM